MMLKAIRLDKHGVTSPARGTFIYVIPSVLSDETTHEVVFVPHSSLCTVDMSLKSCVQEYRANSSKDGYVCISK